MPFLHSAQGIISQEAAEAGYEPSTSVLLKDYANHTAAIVALSSTRPVQDDFNTDELSKV